MYTNFFIVFLLCCVSRIQAQFDLGEACFSDDDVPGVCQYDQLCKEAMELMKLEIHPPMCSWEGNTRIVCCPANSETGPLRRVFRQTNGVITNDHMVCHYDGYLPMHCCPKSKGPKVAARREPAEPCYRRTIETPAVLRQYPAQLVAWEKCAANDRYIEVCVAAPGGHTLATACAISRNQPRIFGGTPAGLGEFPHMAVLGCDNPVPKEEDILWVGGGSIISENYILTAGHVLISIHGNIRYAMVGSLDKTDVRNGDLYHIIRLIPHDKYSTREKYHDIALVELNRPIKFNEFVRPICLPVSVLKPTDSSRRVAGWGMTENNSTSKILLKTVIDVVDGSECRSALEKKNFVWDDATMICARGELNQRNQITDSCTGDSGGPLMYKVEKQYIDCNYVVNGIVSWGNGCAIAGVPASYTNVSAYLDWIVGVVWPEELRIAENNRSF